MRVESHDRRRMYRDQILRAPLHFLCNYLSRHHGRKMRSHGALLGNEVRRARLHELNHIVHEPIYREDALGI